MSHQQASISFGFPEFWPTVLEAYPEFFARKGNLEASLKSVIGRKYEHIDRQQRLLHDMLMLVVHGFAEILILVGNGMSLGAMKIVRNTLENAINARYIYLFPDQADKYEEWQWIASHKFYMNLDPDLLSEVPADELFRVKSEYNRVRHLFTYEVVNCKGQVETKQQREWCRHNLFERASKVGTSLGRVYVEVMPIANSILHGSIDGLLRHMSAESDSQFEQVPNLTYAGQALSAAHAATLITLEALALSLGVDPDPSIEGLSDDYRAIWNPNSQQEVL